MFRRELISELHQWADFLSFISLQVVVRHSFIIFVNSRVHWFTPGQLLRVAAS